MPRTPLEAAISPSSFVSFSFKLERICRSGSWGSFDKSVEPLVGRLWRASQPGSDVRQLVADRHVLAGFAIPALARGHDIRLCLESRQRSAGVLQLLAHFVELRRKPPRGLVGLGGFERHRAVDCRRKERISDQRRRFGSPELYLIARTLVPIVNSGLTFATKLAAIHSSMLSRPNELDFRKFC